MKKWILNGLHGINYAALAGQIFSFFPANPKVMALQALLAAFMLSAFGVGHALVFGGRQEDAPSGGTGK